MKHKSKKDRDIITKGFIAEGTTCTSCEKIIERQALKVDGVKSVKFDYTNETGRVTFDSAKTDIDTILSSVEEKGYTCFIIRESSDAHGKSSESSSSPSNNKSIFGWLFAVAGFILVLYFAILMSDKIALPDLTTNMSYGLLFLVGLLTGFHCIAMCGGFVISYTAKAAADGKKAHFSHLAYGVGKVLSYVIIGALFGLLGSFIAFTPALKAAIGILAGLFLVLFGLKMLNIFPWLRKLSFRTPKFLVKIIGKEQSENSSPFIIGLLNGLMLACGPLQAMYVLAAGTGSMLEGAKLLLMFGLGTLPVMIGFGYVASMLSSRATKAIVKVSGVLVIILGLIMLNRGLALSGTGYDLKSIVARSQFNALQGSPNPGDIDTSNGANQQLANNIAVQKDGYQEIRMDVLRSGWSPDTFVLKKGVPVQWIINGKEITGCNKAIQVPKYGLSFNIKKGEQTITFTPTESGVVSWSCWMGMIQGMFIVKDDISNTAEVANDIKAAASAPSTGGGCGCGGGGAGGSCGG